MFPDHRHPDSIVTDRDQMPGVLATPLTTILSRTQLLQHQLLRADGLSTPERALLLGNLAAVLAAAQQLENHLRTLILAEPGADQPGLPLNGAPPGPEAS
jgi:hypothetical protein